MLPYGLIKIGDLPVTSVVQVIYVWVMTFGMIGLFRWLLTRENRTVRYLSDSSYWLYIAHVPLIIVAQDYVRDWELPAFIKFLLISSVVIGLLLLMYQTVIRYTVLGRILNGPRRREPANPKPAG